MARSNQNKEICLFLRCALYTQKGRVVIDEHMNVEKKLGQVAFGKIGRPLGSARIRSLNEQIVQSGKCDVFFVTSKFKARQIYKAELVEAMRVLKDKYRNLVPDYYRDEKIHSVISTWFVLKHIQPITEIKRGAFITVTARSDIVDALEKSMLGFFITHRAS